MLQAERCGMAEIPFGRLTDVAADDMANRWLGELEPTPWLSREHRAAVIARFVHDLRARPVWAALMPALERKRRLLGGHGPKAFMWMVLECLEEAERAAPESSKQKAQDLNRLAEQTEALLLALVENRHARRAMVSDFALDRLPDDLERLAERLRTEAKSEPLVKRAGADNRKVAFCRLALGINLRLFGSPRWDVLADVCSLALDMELGPDDIRPLIGNLPAMRRSLCDEPKIPSTPAKRTELDSHQQEACRRAIEASQELHGAPQWELLADVCWLLLGLDVTPEDLQALALPGGNPAG